MTVDFTPVPRIEIRRGLLFHRFVVIAKNGEIIAVSEHYTTRRRALSGAHALRETFAQHDVPIIVGA